MTHISVQETEDLLEEHMELHEWFVNLDIDDEETNALRKLIILQGELINRKYAAHKKGSASSGAGAAGAAAHAQATASDLDLNMNGASGPSEKNLAKRVHDEMRNSKRIERKK